MRLSRAFTMNKSSLATLLVLSIGACDAFLSSHSLRRLRTSLDAAPPPPPPWNSKITTPSSITGRLGKSAPEYPIGEVVCVGDMLYDCIANDDAKGWPIEKVVAEEKWTAFPGGAPANVATALTKLGTSSAFAGCLGTDDYGDHLQSILTDAGVNVSLVTRTSAAPTRRVMVSRSLEGDREFAGFAGGLPADAFADCLYKVEDIPGDPIETNGLPGTKWIVSSTLSLAFPDSAAAVKTIVNQAIEDGARVCVDINWRPVFWPKDGEDMARREILAYAQQADVVKLTDEESEWLFGINAVDAFANPELIREHFPKAIGILVTAGKKGAAYWLLGQIGRVPVFDVQVTETTGAGDAFTAGFIHGLLAMDIDIDMFNVLTPQSQRAQLMNLLVTFASACGALTCTKEGGIAAQPSIDEVQAFLLSNE